VALARMMLVLCRRSSAIGRLLFRGATTSLAALLADTAVKLWAVLLANGLSTMLCFLRAWFWSAFACCHVIHLSVLGSAFHGLSNESDTTHRVPPIQRNLPGLSQDVCQSGCFVQSIVDYFPQKARQKPVDWRSAPHGQSAHTPIPAPAASPFSIHCGGQHTIAEAMSASNTGIIAYSYLASHFRAISRASSATGISLVPAVNVPRLPRVGTSDTHSMVTRLHLSKRWLPEYLCDPRALSRHAPSNSSPSLDGLQKCLASLPASCMYLRRHAMGWLSSTDGLGLQ